MCLSFSPNIFRKAPSNRHTKKNKRSASRYSKHAQTGYPHASLQLFHQAVTLDVNPGGERQKKGRRQRGVKGATELSGKPEGFWIEPGQGTKNAQSKNPPWQWPPPSTSPLPNGHSSGHTRGALEQLSALSKFTQRTRLPTQRPFSGRGRQAHHQNPKQTYTLNLLIFSVSPTI